MESSTKDILSLQDNCKVGEVVKCSEGFSKYPDLHHLVPPNQDYCTWLSGSTKNPCFDTSGFSLCFRASLFTAPSIFSFIEPFSDILYLLNRSFCGEPAPRSWARSGDLAKQFTSHVGTLPISDLYGTCKVGGGVGLVSLRLPITFMEGS